MGLSGGIDSALTLAIAVDAIGADKVQAVMMPYTYTSQMSVEDATEQARRMGVTFGIAEIHPIVNSFMQTFIHSLAIVQPMQLKKTCRHVPVVRYSWDYQ